jgi:hypothetical protein
MAPPVTWSVRALGWARWRLLRGRGRVCLPRPRSSPSPWVGRVGDRRLRPGLSPSPGVGRSGVHRLPGLSPSSSPGVGRCGVRRLPGLSPSPSHGVERSGVRRLLGLSLSPSPGVGQSGVRHLPGLSPSLSPGSGEAEFVVFRGRARVRALGRARRSFLWRSRPDLAAVSRTVPCGAAVGAAQAALSFCQAGQRSGEVTAVTSALLTEGRASG